MASSQKWPRLVISYLVAYFLFYSLSSIVFTIYANNFSGDKTGAGVGLAIALPLMFLLASIFYFFVPGSTYVAIYFLGNFVLRASSVLKSVLMAVGIWLVTFLPALALINVIYAGSPNMMIQATSWPFLYLLAGSNLAGLIASVIWVRLRPVKTN